MILNPAAAQPSRCLTLPVAGMLSAYGPRLGMPAARPGETAAAPIVLTTTQTGGREPMADLLRALAGRTVWAAAPPAFDRQPSVPTGTYAATPSVQRVASPPAPTPVAYARPTSPPRPHAQADAPSYDERLRAARPVDHDPTLGWTASD